MGISICFQTNAMYMPQLNSIVVPIGIQQPPIYRDQQLQVLTFGSLGFVVGHEFTHGFDNNGAKFDKEGNFRVSNYDYLLEYTFTFCRNILKNIKAKKCSKYVQLFI